MIKFRCSQCKQEHVSLYNVDFTLPKVIIEELKVGALAYESSERWFIIENKYFFVKALLKISINDFDHDFDWLVWVMLDQKDFVGYIEILKNESKYGTSLLKTGTLAAEIPVLGETMGLRVVLDFKKIDLNSFFDITLLDENTGLGRMQANKITKEEAMLFMESYHHFELQK